MQADPWPLKDIFIRSDQYNFVRDGIPALMMMDGAAPGSPEEKLLMEWLHDRYHAPSDDTNQPVDLAAGKFEDIVRDLTLPTGLVDYKVCAVNETWSGLAFAARRAKRANAR